MLTRLPVAYAMPIIFVCCARRSCSPFGSVTLFPFHSSRLKAAVPLLATNLLRLLLEILNSILRRLRLAALGLDL